MSQIYSKDSLDRFGDDLCQHMLSFLSLEDRFRFECLSKQWQRCVYETQTRLTITRKLCAKLNINSQIESMLQKLPNIADIVCEDYVSNRMFEAIVKHYCHLHAIHVWFVNDINIDTIETFITKFAKQLNAIAIHRCSQGISNAIPKSYGYMTYPKTNRYLHFNRHLQLLLNPSPLHPYLRKVGIDYQFKLYNSPQFTAFATNYAHVLQSLYLRTGDISTDNELKALINDISRLKSLRDLRIGFSELVDPEPQSDSDSEHEQDMDANDNHANPGQGFNAELNPELNQHINPQLAETDNYWFPKVIAGLTQIGLNLQLLKRLSLNFYSELNECIIIKGSEYRQLMHCIHDNYKRLTRLEICLTNSEELVLPPIGFTCGQQWKRITHLTLDFVVDVNVIADIVNCFPNLQYFWFEIVGENDTNGQSLTQSLHLLSQLRNIQYISIGYWDNDVYDQSVLDHFMICPKMKAIDLSLL
ncbi:unnamed protein product [Oppiella nova]|uniref:F-box domain-containing protein n=1 Tax=Oppiella nova TaxID=334625 RepID=A0A7R9M8C3_9ACAR|nr:unnamed protein product [Oppiella nova]CAG2172520.1 unnamed protein product [Oppiella nova]